MNQFRSRNMLLLSFCVSKPSKIAKGKEAKNGDENEIGRYIDKLYETTKSASPMYSQLTTGKKKTLIEWLLSLFHHMHAVVVRRQIFRSQVKRFNLECFAGKCCNGKCCRHLGIPWSWSWVSPFNYRCSHCSDAWTGYGYGWLWPMGGFVPVYCNCCRRF